MENLYKGPLLSNVIYSTGHLIWGCDFLGPLRLSDPGMTVTSAHLIVIPLGTTGVHDSGGSQSIGLEDT